MLFAHCGPSQTKDATAREVLAASLVSTGSTLLDITRGFVLINHRIHIYLDREEETNVKDMLFLLAHAVESAQRKLPHDEYKRLLEHMFDMDSVKRLCEQPLSTMLREGDSIGSGSICGSDNNLQGSRLYYSVQFPPRSTSLSYPALPVSGQSEQAQRL